MKDRIVVMFNILSEGKTYDLNIPLNITANELVTALVHAYKLDVDISDINQCYLNSENPIALIKGNKKLSEFGLRNGTIINFTR